MEISFDLHNTKEFSVFSAGLESVVEKESGKNVEGGDLFCTACQMTVVWVQNQLKQSKTKDYVLDYVNKVTCSEINSLAFSRLTIQ